MGGVEISIDGLDELTADLEKVINEYPKETAKMLNKTAKEFRKDYVHKVRAKAKTKSGKSKSLEKLKNVKIYSHPGLEKSEALDIGATSPHFHLFERGHNLIIPRNGVTGYVEGRYCMKDTIEEYDKKMPGIAEDIVKTLLKDGGLD